MQIQSRGDSLGTQFQAQGIASFNEFELFSSLTTIAVYAFYNCRQLVEIKLPNGLRKMPQAMFNNCISLPTITIPASVTEIVQVAFQNCTGLREMIFMGTTPPTVGNLALGQTNFTFPIYVPDSAVATYKAASSWSSYANRVKGISERPTQ